MTKSQLATLIHANVRRRYDVRRTKKYSGTTSARFPPPSLPTSIRRFGASPRKLQFMQGCHRRRRLP